MQVAPRMLPRKQPHGGRKSLRIYISLDHLPGRLRQQRVSILFSLSLPDLKDTAFWVDIRDFQPDDFAHPQP